MAAAWSCRLRGIRSCLISAQQIRFYNGSRRVADGRWFGAFKVTAASAVVGYVAYKFVTGVTDPAHSKPVKAAKDAGHGNGKKSQAANLREMTFLSFASVEYEGNVYMTPEDFLESLTEDKPRPRSSRRKLRQNEVEKWLKSTPSKSKGTHHFFRKLLDKGLISYTEYLFLLCVLTKPQSGFQIAFNMFDTDGDQRVDKKEFLVLEKLMAHASGSTPRPPRDGSSEMLDVLSSIEYHHQPPSHTPDHANIWAMLDNINVLMHVYQRSIGQKLDHSAMSDTDRVPRSVRANIWNLLRSDEHAEGSGETELSTDTTLTIHFFGTKGKDVLTYQDFHRFMDNLQTEVLELEFNEFSHGMPTIHEQDFARILLRYTILTKEAHEDFLDRLSRRIPHSQGISFSDFKEFCQFLNNLDDFALAMRIYTFADHPISEADFQRAVKACTGQNLNSHLIHVVFQLFDTDGDGKLSHKEFVAVMKERLHRGTRTGVQGRWDIYKTCIKNEMKSA